MKSFEVDNKEILLIGGAPRSGTTLISNLLESHHDFFVFPLEHGVLETYYNTTDLEVFRERFITERIFGQQTIFSSESNFQTYADKVRKILGRDFEIKVDYSAYTRAYKEYMATCQVTLDNIFRALAFSLIKSSDYYKRCAVRAQYIVFKQPFYTEFYCAQVMESNSQAKFVCIYRDLYDRYCSAKSRQLREGGGGFSRRINKLPSNLGSCEISLISRYLIESNAINNDNFYAISYESLVSDPESTELNSVIESLGCQNCPLSQMEFGQPVSSNSSAGRGVGSKRKATYHNITSKNERTVNAFFINRVSDAGLSQFEGEKISFFRFILAWVFKFSGETNRDFFIRIVLTPIYLKKIFGYDLSHEVLKIQSRIRKGTFGVSGAV